jgi:hypothetical protein
MRIALKLSPMKVLLDMAIIVAVAGDEALEVGGFVEEGGEEVVVAVGEAVGGGAVGGVG